ncbi:hypothetical protein CHISP_2132 [Chitinispirillum alkaliphilum]|nr:hypothetical protein CHISP_2132 [Chitinispirillum alkaliphilum]
MYLCSNALFWDITLQTKKKKQRIIELSKAAYRSKKPKNAPQVKNATQPADDLLESFAPLPESQYLRSAPESNMHSSSGLSFNNLIIKDARKGLGIQEISRRYQISTDQVLLILKVSESKRNQNN